LVSGELWALLVFGSLLAGAAFVGVLVAPKRLEPAFGLTGAASFAVAAWAFARITEAVPAVQTVLVTFGIIVGSLVGGYALASGLLDRLAVPLTETVELELPLPQSRDKAMVIVVACAEAEAYSPRIAAAELRNLAQEGLVDPTLGLAPFLFTAQKARYRSVGGTSPQRRLLEQLSERVAPLLDESLVGAVEWAVCSGKEALARRIADGAADGYTAFAVVSASAADSPHLEHARRGVDTLRVREHGLSVMYSDALSSDDRIAELIADQVMSSAQDPATTGVALVAHGQPEHRARQFPLFDEQETAFVSRIRMILAERGIPEANIRLCWAEWRSPDVTSTVRHLAALDCRRILVAPAAFPADSLATLLDIPMAARQARVESGVPVITVPTWHDDPVVLDVIKEMAEKVVREALEATRG